MQPIKTIPLALFISATLLTSACSRREEAPPPAMPDLSTSPIPSAPSMAASPATDGMPPPPLPSSSAVMEPASAASAASAASMSN